MQSKLDQEYVTPKNPLFAKKVCKQQQKQDDQSVTTTTSTTSSATQHYD